ncbi:MAG: radical SAM protein [Oligoflexia bacterium]|nr:radical SAM protein [Oligoflexia bacterium]
MNKVNLIGKVENFFLKNLSNCRLCPRQCNVNRLEGSFGFCKHTGENVLVATVCDHHGEEPVISGSKGSGTIFFSHCNLECSYCQNHQISKNTFNNPPAHEMSIEQLKDQMLKLQSKGCHNINLVTPTHFVAHIILALKKAYKQGLKIPIVYNCGGYEDIDVIKALEGIVDIFLPDFKYSDESLAQKHSHCNNYFSNAKLVMKELFRQTNGQLKLDSDNVAIEGLIIRHLILPGEIENSKNILKFLASELSNQLSVSLMSQYNPPQNALINRPLKSSEYEEITNYLLSLGFDNGWLQDMDSKDTYNIDFEQNLGSLFL